MIILDTQVLRGMSLDSAEARLVRVIRESQTDQVALPWMAFEERIAQYVLEYEQAHAKVLSAHRELARKLPRPDDASAPTLVDPSAVRAQWEKRLRDLVDVIPADAGILREALVREANQRPPAGTKRDTKTGARDVVIWLTAVEYASTHPDKTVYFISGNTNDFTDGKGAYPAPMDKDRERAGDKFVHLTALSDLLEQLAPPVSVSTQEVEERLGRFKSQVPAQALRLWGGEHAGFGLPVPALRRSTGRAEQVRFATLAPTPFDVQLLQVDNTKAYKLGDSVWCTAEATWQFIGSVLRGSSPDQACCTWTTHLMLSLADDGPAPQFFDASQPEAPESSEGIVWPACISSTGELHLADAARQYASDALLSAAFSGMWTNTTQRLHEYFHGRGSFLQLKADRVLEELDEPLEASEVAGLGRLDSGPPAVGDQEQETDEDGQKPSGDEG